MNGTRNREDISAKSVPAKEADGKWQPIETAPRDGTEVLLWAESWEMTWGVQMGYFCDENHRWETPEGSAEDNDDDFDPDAEVFDESCADINLGPTHWLPIPAPPVRP